jgi:hypothetical protein
MDVLSWPVASLTNDGHCRDRQGAECCLLSGPGGCLACRRFVSLSLPAQRMPANMRLHERPILYTDHWLMLERRRLQRLGLSEDHAQSELDTMLQRKQENRTDRSVDQRMAFDELSYALHRQVTIKVESLTSLLNCVELNKFSKLNAPSGRKSKHIVIDV